MSPLVVLCAHPYYRLRRQKYTRSAARAARRSGQGARRAAAATGSRRPRAALLRRTLTNENTPATLLARPQHKAFRIPTGGLNLSRARLLKAAS